MSIAQAVVGLLCSLLILNGLGSEMVTEATVSGQSAERRREQFDVTGLSFGERRRLFVCCFVEGGFIGFSKRRVGHQTYYVFTYKT